MTTNELERKVEEIERCLVEKSKLQQIATK